MSIQPKVRLVFAAIVVVVSFSAAQQDKAEKLYQQALYEMAGTGNYAKAIDLFNQVVAKYPKEKLVAAKSLLGVGKCDEKLGKSEARKAYNRILGEFADQKQIAAEARSRLTALDNVANHNEKPSMTTKRVWFGEGTDVEGSISSDGRYISFTDWSTGDLTVRDLVAGVNRRLTHKGDWTTKDFVETSIISPDGKEVAYTWFNANGVDDIRVVDTDGSEPRVIYKSDEITYYQPDAWTRDQKFLVTILFRKDRTTQIALVSTTDHSTRILKSFAWGAPKDLNVSPDGRWIAYSFPPKENETQQDIFLLATDGIRETHLIQDPANDSYPIWTPDGRTILFVSDRGRSQGLWLIRVADGKSVGDPELLKADIGDVTPLGITENGDYYYGTVGMPGTGADIYSVTIDPVSSEFASEPQQVTQKYIGVSMSPDWSPDGNSLGYIVHPASLSVPGNAIVIRSLATGDERELPHPGLEVVGGIVGLKGLEWSPTENSLLVMEIPDSLGRTHTVGLYKVDAQTGGAKLLLKSGSGAGGIGHFGWFPDGKSIFRFRYLPDNTSITRLNLVTGEEQELFRVKDKEVVNDLRCLKLSPDGKQFACWKMMKDAKSLMLIPTNGGPTKIILTEKIDFARITPQPAGIAWTPDGRQLMYGSRISAEITELWRIAIEGGKPQRVGVVNKSVYEIALHPDGKHIAFSTREYKPEVWVMENFLPKESNAQ